MAVAYTARKAFRVPTFRKALLKQMSKKIQKECNALCSTKDQKSPASLTGPGTCFLAILPRRLGRMDEAVGWLG